MYLVGLTTQAAVLGVVVAALLSFETPIRARLGLPAAGPGLAPAVAALDARVDALPARSDLAALDGKVTALSERVDALAVAVGAGGDAAAAGAGATLAERIDRIDAVVARLEGKVDDVRDSTLFPPASAPER